MKHVLHPTYMHSFLKCLISSFTLFHSLKHVSPFLLLLFDFNTEQKKLVRFVIFQVAHLMNHDTKESSITIKIIEKKKMFTLITLFYHFIWTIQFKFVVKCFQIQFYYSNLLDFQGKFTSVSG